MDGSGSDQALSLITLALVHGLVVLGHGGALRTVTGADAHALAETFSALPRANPPNRGPAS